MLKSWTHWTCNIIVYELFEGKLALSANIFHELGCYLLIDNVFYAVYRYLVIYQKTYIIQTCSKKTLNIEISFFFFLIIRIQQSNKLIYT